MTVASGCCAFSHNRHKFAIVVHARNEISHEGGISRGAGERCACPLTPNPHLEQEPFCPANARRKSQRIAIFHLTGTAFRSLVAGSAWYSHDRWVCGTRWYQAWRTEQELSYRRLTMLRASYKCSKCNRKFGMPAHLARHMTTIHARKGAAKSKRRAASKGKRPVGRPPGSTAKTSRGTVARAGRPRMASSDSATRLLSDMQLFQNDLLDRRTSLDGEIEGVARAMEALGATGRATAGRKPAHQSTRGRPSGSGFRAGSLKSFIVKVLGQISKPLSPQDIGARVVKAGFKTNSKDITKAVSNTLPKLRGVKRVGFGIYTMSGRK